MKHSTNEQEFSPTRIEEMPTKKPLAILGIIGGALMVFPLSIIGFSMFILPGIALIIFGIGVIIDSIQMLKGRIKAVCPYCGRKRVLKNSATAFKCVSCKKSSAIKDGYAIPLE